MAKIRITITESRCRSGYHKAGDTFVVGDICPPLCHELWHAMYPYVCTLQNGGDLDYGETRRKAFDAQCPDGGRVRVHAEAIEEDCE